MATHSALRSPSTAKRFAVCSFTGEVSYGIYDGAYLTWRISLTDDEIVTNRIAYLGKVCYDDFLPFLS